MVLVKGTETIKLNNENHIEAYLKSGWKKKEIAPSEQKEKVTK